jgi:hypothetical protein
MKGKVVNENFVKLGSEYFKVYFTIINQEYIDLAV